MPFIYFFHSKTILSDALQTLPCLTLLINLWSTYYYSNFTCEECYPQCHIGNPCQRQNLKFSLSESKVWIFFQYVTLISTLTLLTLAINSVHPLWHCEYSEYYLVWTKIRGSKSIRPSSGKVRKTYACPFLWLLLFLIPSSLPLPLNQKLFLPPADIWRSPYALSPFIYQNIFSLSNLRLPSKNFNISNCYPVTESVNLSSFVSLGPVCTCQKK